MGTHISNLINMAEEIRKMALLFPEQEPLLSEFASLKEARLYHQLTDVLETLMTSTPVGTSPHVVSFFHSAIAPLAKYINPKSYVKYAVLASRCMDEPETVMAFLLETCEAVRALVLGSKKNAQRTSQLVGEGSAASSSSSSSSRTPSSQWQTRLPCGLQRSTR